MRIHVEGYGCSMNRADTEAIKGHALANSFSESAPGNADFLVINTCAVKEQTEFKMLQRIRELNKIAEEKNSQLIVFGCLPKINPALVEGLSSNIIQMGPDLVKLSQVLGIREEEFSPGIMPAGDNPHISILPICRGCTNYCTFCGTKFARGNIKSYPIELLKNRFEESLENGVREFWLTGQDSGAYGLDMNSSLPKLLESFLEVKGDFRIRIGMMNPHHLRRIYQSLIPLFSDPRIYKFLHVPLQAGSERVLREMRRGYTSAQYEGLVKMLKKDVPNITIATDVIVGFPGETEDEFLKTLKILKATKPDIVNISRFGSRPGTVAASMPGQLHGRDKKERSRKLTSVCRALSFQANRRMEGAKERVFVSEKGQKGRFVGRTSNYKPVIVSSDLRGRFIDVEITGAYPSYLEARVLEGEKAFLISSKP
ncbi:MAG: tRNA (N(6)-L-threonylcarbamoyladenosine(37)-C(2))-methylthiotransferase [archaeon]|nr:tRNA (N(6)-L-threonylcarbamoyladenosine(37)-C(2))-methylthiotransferase [archaeon]